MKRQQQQLQHQHQQQQKSFFCFHMSGQKSVERIVNDDDGPLQKIFHFLGNTQTVL